MGRRRVAGRPALPAWHCPGQEGGGVPTGRIGVKLSRLQPHGQRLRLARPCQRRRGRAKGHFDPQLQLPCCHRPEILVDSGRFISLKGPRQAECLKELGEENVCVGAAFYGVGVSVL
jgi:hypothetical protein